MSKSDPDALLQAASDWWATSVIDIHPGEIDIRGYPVQELIGQLSFVEMIWLMTRGELAGAGQAGLLEAALVASVDHGPHAPSIAIAQMAASCGIALNNVMATSINVLGDTHGGAGQDCMVLYGAARRRLAEGETLGEAVEGALDAFIAEKGKIIPGFGHRFHPVDPRAKPLLDMVRAAAEAGVVEGSFVAIGLEIEAALERRKGKRIPMNIDGATAVIFAELGFAPEMGRGLFILSRSVGILAHGWDALNSGRRNKGPMPKEIPFTYAGAGRRAFKRPE
jgi:citrate synthase